MTGLSFDGYLSVEHPGHGGRDDPWETARRDGEFLAEVKWRFAGRAPS